MYRQTVWHGRPRRRVAMVLLSLVGCGIEFEPDEPEPPTQAQIAELSGQVERLLEASSWERVKEPISGPHRRAIEDRAKQRWQGRMGELTGIGQRKIVKPFVTDMKAFLRGKDWAQITPMHRAKLLRDKANAALAAVGVAGIRTYGLDEATGGKAYFDWQLWELQFREALLKKNELDGKEVLQLTTLLLHEARHVEQLFRAARLLARQGRTASEIAKSLGIPTKIAEEAALVPLPESLTGRRERREARTWYEEYGPGRARHRATETRVEDAVKSLNEGLIGTRRHLAELRSQASRANYRALVSARDRLVKRVSSAQKTFQDYLALPSEADAYEVGGMVSAVLGGGQ